MTSRERLLCAMANERPDRVPVGPFGMGRVSAEMAAELIAKTDPFISTGLGGNAFMGQLVKTERVQEGNDTVTTIFTPKGNLTQRYRRTDITGYTVEFPCKNAEDVEKYMSIPYKPSEPNVESFLAKRDEIGQDALVMGGLGDAICLPATIMSPMDMCLFWADEPDLMIQMVQTVSDRLLEFVEKACKAV